MKKYILILSAVLCITAIVCSCSDKLSGSSNVDEYEALVVGRWKLTKSEEYNAWKVTETEVNGEREMVFNEEGMCEFVYHDKGETRYHRYSVSGDFLVMAEDEQYYIKTLNNTELVLCEVPPYAPDAKEGYNTILYFKRVAESL